MRELTRLLIVDDDPDARLLLSRMFSKSFRTEVAKNAQVALDKVSHFMPNIVLTDIKMPGESGLELLKKIKSIAPNTLVVLITGHGDKQVLYEGLTAGAFDYVEKPCDEHLLRHALERADKFYRDFREFESNRQYNRVLEKFVALGELASTVTHEVNTPLAYITANVGILKEHYEAFKSACIDLKKQQNMNEVLQVLDASFESKMRLTVDAFTEEVNELFTETEKGLARIAHITRLLRNYSRAQPDYSEVIRIKQLLVDVMGILKIQSSKAQCIHIVDEADSLLMGNSNELGQVIINLVNNALYAITPDGQVTIRTFSEGNYAYIVVSDNGSGIAQNKLDKIFEPFVTTKELGDGTGLGLYISNKIITRHNGEITVESVEGEYTTFTIKLPVAKDVEINNE